MSHPEIAIRRHKHICVFCGDIFDCESLHVAHGYHNEDSNYKLTPGGRCCARCRHFHYVETVRQEIAV